MAKLVLKTDGVIQQEIALGPNPIIIGRDPDCDLPVNQPFLSRKHCRIKFEDGRYTVEDLQSLNGTLLNESPVTKSELRAADTIRIGKVELVFEGDVSESEPAEPSGPKIESDAEEVLQEFSLHSQASMSIPPPAAETTLSGIGDTSKGSQMFFSLYQISKKLCQQGDLDHLTRLVMLSIFEVMTADRGILFLRDQKTQAFSAQVHYDRYDGFLSDEPKGYSTSILKRAFDEHVATLTSDATTDPRFQNMESIILDQIRSVLCVPLWDHETSHGAIYLESSNQAFPFSREDQALLCGIANLLALRIKLEKEERLRNSLGQYHSPDVVELLMKNEGKLVTGRKEVTLLFADIRNSVGLTEKLGETGIHGLLNSFYEMSADAVFAHKGHVNKYIGDAVLAVFNAPLEVDQHEICGVRAAQELMRRVHEFNASTPERAFALRIGINTGHVIAGNIGPRHRLEYAVIGDPVNVSERLSKQETESGIAVAEESWNRAKEEFEGKFIHEIQVKGRQKPVRIYEVFAK